MQRLVVLLAALLALTGCTELTLAWADLSARGETAAPPLPTPPGDSAAAIAQWEETARPQLEDAIQANVFGYLPENSETRLLGVEVIDPAGFNGAGRLEQVRIDAVAGYGETRVSTNGDGVGGDFSFYVVHPLGHTGPRPVILMETFCSTASALNHEKVPDDGEGMGGVAGAIAAYVFGRHICTPPVERILRAGYAIAIMHPGDVIPDRREAGLAALNTLAAGHTDAGSRLGAIAAWGWMYSRMVDALEEDARIDQDRIVLWGHSRYAKAALVAAAFDARIDGVIAHQSGTGGASLNWRKVGESIGSITGNYPHWFAARYADFADANDGKGPRPDFDQHYLLALIAPRPIFLGNARRDVWSDPNGAFRAALAANDAYRLYGSDGLTAQRLSDFHPDADIAFWIRPGTHGVVSEDWPAFFAFLNAHFGGEPNSAAGANQAMDKSANQSH